MMPSFLFVGDGPESDHLLVWTHYNGVATCVEPKTGKQLWQHRLDGNYSASPTYAAGKIYFLNEDGKMSIVEAGKVFTGVAENTINTGEHFQASPAFSNGQIFIRSDKHLFCIK
jgi:outer membrane protein assembly factor BamB